jgi:hypothetical protein
VNVLNSDINIYNKIRAWKGYHTELIKKLIIWRLKTMNVRWPLEVFLFEFLKKIRAAYYQARTTATSLTLILFTTLFSQGS